MSSEEKAARKAWCWSVSKANLSEAILMYRWMKKSPHLDEETKKLYNERILVRLGMANDYRALAKSGYETIHIHPSLIW